MSYYDTFNPPHTLEQQTTDRTTDRLLGEMTSDIKYIRERIAEISESQQKLRDDVDELKLTVAKARGAGKAVEWIKNGISAIIGGVVSVIGVLVSLGVLGGGK